MTDFAIRIMTAPLGKTHIFSVGQAGFVIKSAGGELLGIDLYLSDCVERVEGHAGYKRLLPKILNPYDLVFDAVVATHFHRDHFDIDAIPQLTSNGKTKLFAAEDCRETVAQLEMTDRNVTYVKPGMICKAGDFMIRFVDCDHGTGAPEAVGVIITVDGKNIYEAGDTCLRLDRVSQIKEFGDVDVLIAPINGAYGNMNEQECAQFADALGAKLTIPCHYGMFASHGGDSGIFYDYMNYHYPDREFCIMTQGECLTILR